MFAVSWGKFMASILPIGLVACASGNVLSHAEKDRSIITGSIPKTTSATDNTDEETIRNAVTSVDPKQIGPDGLAWVNPATGASGQITGLTEFQENGRLCRRFSTSITRFDGVTLYSGEACFRSEGGWQLRALASS
jgi:surface antigen